MTPAPSPAVRYVVRAANPAAHRWHVEMHIAQPHAAQRVSLPVWVPGSYLVREFSRFLDGLRAECGGRPCALQRVNKNTWELHGEPGQPVVLHYEVYAFDGSPRGAWLDAERGFFNGTALLLRAHGLDGAPHALEVLAPPEAPQWCAAVTLEAAAAGSVDARGFGAYAAPSYAALVDAPLVMGRLWQGEFEAGGVPHRFAITGATPAFDGARLLRDAQSICQTAIAMWRSPQQEAPPFSRYLFILHAGQAGGGGLEHADCSVLGCGRQHLPRLHAERENAPSEGYLKLLGLIAHEYFHAWCVKRLRPFESYDFERENHTELLWFFEGFTTYYEDIILRRAGMVDGAGYLKRLALHIEEVQRSPGRLRQAVAQASYDAWLRFYRADENTPNSTVNYYAKGALVALCLDLTLRAEGRGTLDDAMRALWQRCAGAGGSGLVREADISVALAQAGGRSFEPELAAWIHGTDELPLEPLLAGCGVCVRRVPASATHALGLRVHEGSGGIEVRSVLEGSAAAHAGVQAGDEWLAVRVQQPGGDEEGDFWRLHRAADVLLYTRPGQRVQLLVARDGRLRRLELDMPAAGAPQTLRWELLPPPPETSGWPEA